MRTIYKIAKTELQTLFYSPIAWMIIVIFVFQTGMIFANLLEELLRTQIMLGQDYSGITESLFGGRYGIFTQIQSSLYLYIPLLTMGLMSREFNSGSIKLLYNAPITNRQIILGKYLSMLIYAFVLALLLLVFIVFASMRVEHLDWGYALSGLLGIYLLICVYSAIGLFMSSLTSYQLVAALCTLSLLAALNYVGFVWQNIDFVRDLTYWLSMSGRAQKFISGLICSEDVLYFVILITLFLVWTIIQLQAARQKSRWFVTWGKFFALFLGVIFLGYFTSRPKLKVFYDATQTKSMSVVPECRELIEQLEGGMTMTTYANILSDQFGYVSSRSVNEDLQQFQQYLRFKPEIKVKYVYYYPKDADMRRVAFNADLYDEDLDKILPSDQLDIPIDSIAEGIGVIRVFERENGQREILPIYSDQYAHPNEEDFMAMFRRFLVKAPKVAFVVGHGERSMSKSADWNYRLFARTKNFRHSLINTGVDPIELTLDREVPGDVNALVLGDARENMTGIERANLQKYIDRGGNLFITTKPRYTRDMEEIMEQFGVTLVPGCLVRPNDQFAPNILLSFSMPETADKIGGMLGDLIAWEGAIIGVSCCGMEYVTDRGFYTMPLFQTEYRGVWNEMETTNFVDDTVTLNPKAGEVEKSYVTGLALSRGVSGKLQKIVVFGNADYFTDAGLRFKAADGIVNLQAMTASFWWLLDGYSPIQVVRPNLPDDHISMSREGSEWLGFGFMGVYPGVLLLLAIGLWIWRKSK